MIIKNETVNKTTGEKSINFTTDKPGWKIVMKNNLPIEIKMTQEERSNRDHGASTNGHGSEGSKKIQKGQGKINIKKAKEYREKNIVGESSVDIRKKAKKVEDLMLRLKKAKLDYGSAMLDQKMSEFEKKENFYKRAADVNLNKRSKIKQKNKFYMEDEKVNPNAIDDIGKDIVEKISNIINSDTTKEKVVNESKDLFYKIDKTLELNKMFFGEKNEKSKIDLLDRITLKLNEAENDEEEPEEPEESGETAPEEDGLEDEDEDGDSEEDLGDLGDEEGDGEEDLPEEEPEGMPMEKNEIDMIMSVNNFNLDSNNSYVYYDYIIDRLRDSTSKTALNAEYKDIDESKRKVTPARELHDRAVKRLELLNRTEQDRLNDELSGTSGEDDGDELEI